MGVCSSTPWTLPKKWPARRIKKRKCLSRRRVFALPALASTFSGTPAGGSGLGAPSLGYFSWRDKKSNRLPGRPRQSHHGVTRATASPEKAQSTPCLGKPPHPQPPLRAPRLGLQAESATAARIGDSRNPAFAPPAGEGSEQPQSAKIPKNNGRTNKSTAFSAVISGTHRSNMTDALIIPLTRNEAID
jgi:hypothetical protein